VVRLHAIKSEATVTSVV